MSLEFPRAAANHPPAHMSMLLDKRASTVDVKSPLPLSTLDLSTLSARLLLTDLWKARLALQLALLVLLAL